MAIPVTLRIVIVTALFLNTRTATALPQGQVGCPTSLDRRSPDTMRHQADSQKLQSTAAILRSWRGDVELADDPDPDRRVMTSLRDTVGPEVGSALLALMLNSPPSWQPGQFTLESAAAHFYAALNLPPEPLRAVLEGSAPDFEQHGLDAVFSGLSAIEGHSHSLSPSRQYFVCALASRVLKDTSGAKDRVELLKQIAVVLENEKTSGSRAAAALLESQTLRAALRLIPAAR